MPQEIIDPTDNPDVVQAKVEGRYLDLHVIGPALGSNPVTVGDKGEVVFASAAVVPEQFYAKGDYDPGTGSGSDDTGALQEALNTGRNLNLCGGRTYKVSAPLEMKFDGQRIIGDGSCTIVQVGTLANSTLIHAADRKDIHVSGVRLVPGTTVTGLFTTGGAVHIERCSNFSVVGLTISGHRKGIVVSDSSGGIIALNTIHDGIVWLDPVTNRFGADIGIFNDCSNITVTANQCSRGGQGIIAQTNSQVGHVMTSIAITGNTVRQMSVYGIMAYSDGANVPIGTPNPDTFTGITITGNTVEEITGSTPNPFNNLLDFGAGIYVQGVEGCSVVGNTIRRACLSTTGELLAPGAIGFTNMNTITITGNTIEDSGYFGIYGKDPNNKGRVNGMAVVSANIITNPARNAIYLNDLPRASVTSNGISKAGQNAIFIRNQNTTLWDTVTIAGNTIVATTGSAIQVSAGNSTVEGNIVVGSTVHGLSFSGAFVHVVKNNIIKTCLGRGMNVNADVVDIEATGNIFDSNAVQMYSMAPVRYRDQNKFINPAVGTTVMAGDYGFEPDITGATPSVKNGKFFRKADTTTITNFLDPKQGQVIVIRIQGGGTVTIENNANIITKSGANLTLATNSWVRFGWSGAWREDWG